MTTKVRQKIFHSLNFRLIAASLLAALVFLGMAAWQARAQTTPPVLPAAAPEEPSAGPITCTIGFVAVFNNRVVLRCVEPLPSTIIFDFAAPTDAANSAQTNRYLTLLNTAYALGKQVKFYYISDSGSNPPGCQTTTCRRLDGLYIE